MSRPCYRRAAAVVTALSLFLLLLPGVSADAGLSAASGADAPLSGALAADPVDTYSGEYLRADTDLDQGWLNPLLRFTRYYRSGKTLKSDLGTGWADNYDEVLKIVPDGKGTIFVAWPPFGPGLLAPAPNGRYPVNPIDSLAVTPQGGGALATDSAGTRWTFDAQGKPTSIRDKNGDTVDLTYCSCGLLSTVRDVKGRGALTLHYSASGQLTGVTSGLSTTPVASYTYDGALLKTANNSAGSTFTYGYAPNSSLLTTVTNSKGTVDLTNTYDAKGRIVAQQTASDRARGQETTFSYTTAADGGEVTTIVSPTLPSDPAFHPTFVDTYDAQGNLSRQVDRPNPKTTFTTSFGVSASDQSVVLTSDAAYTANPSGVVNTDASAIPAGCQFTLGFKTLHDLIPVLVGDCLTNATYAANGDAQQQTTNGLLVWRKADNWTAFTNGYWTWINGPAGIAKRLNTQRFPWEANPDHLPVVTASAP